MPGSIVFDDADGQVAKVNYSVPMPGSHHGKRVVRLELDIQDDQWNDAAFAFGTQPGAAAGIVQSGTDITIDIAVARLFLKERLTAAGFNADEVEAALVRLPEVVSGDAEPAHTRRFSTAPLAPVATVATADLTAPPRPPAPVTPADRLDEIIDTFVANAHRGVVTTIGVDSTGDPVIETLPIEVATEPQLFLVEHYAVSSFLGDYGMGRTVRTFTLLPGETTSIRIKTWQSTEQSRKEASSIIDSHEHEAQKRFQNEVQNETTDKKTKSSEEKWSVEAEASASWGWGSAKVSASASGEYQSGREQFSKQVSSSVGEHAAKASSKRELSVTSESETTTTTGSESVIERTISNANVRRVLNFVFRELNQEYTTRLHLTDIRVAFTNRRQNSWHVVPMSGLRQLLDEVLDASKIDADEVASQILKYASVAFNHDDEPIRVLEMVNYNTRTDEIAVEPMTLDASGIPEAPSPERYFRFKRGPLDQDLVDGVLMSEQTIVMRTDSVIVEALLGESDALDDFAMEIQQAAATDKTLRNQREELLQTTLAEIQDPSERAALAAALFKPAPEGGQ